eukprot:GHRR01034468.1.p1 GENE.GHRR01034468.1~~GHRR01034468.1.p1  ORF type:complete len:187 (+),score=108.74 GHRR01034468.1:146-706(+)
MELLTLAALQYLPTSVLFVTDLTEECGTSVADQWMIRQGLKSRFPDKPWVDVLSKADLLQEVWQQVDQQKQQEPQDQQQQQEEVDQQQQHQAVWQQHSKMEGGGSSSNRQQHAELNNPRVVQDAVQFAAALDTAVRLSSVTQQGLQELQQQIVHVLYTQPLPLAAAAATAATTAAAGDSSRGPCIN